MPPKTRGVREKRMLKPIGAALTAAFLVAIPAALAAEKPKDPDIIHIGALFAMTGKTSNYRVGASKYLFHNRSLASDLGRAAVGHAHDLGLKKMGELAWNSDAGENIVKTVDEIWKEGGGTVVASEKMDVGAANIDTQIA